MDKPILERLTNLLVDQLGIRASLVKPEANLSKDFGADSLDCVEMAIAVEEEFYLEIPDEDIEKIKTVQDIVDYLEEHQA